MFTNEPLAICRYRNEHQTTYITSRHFQLIFGAHPNYISQVWTAKPDKFIQIRTKIRIFPIDLIVIIVSANLVKKMRAICGVRCNRVTPDIEWDQNMPKHEYIHWYPLQDQSFSGVFISRGKVLWDYGPWRTESMPSSYEFMSLWVPKSWLRDRVQPKKVLDNKQRNSDKDDWGLER